MIHQIVKTPAVAIGLFYNIGQKENQLHFITWVTLFASPQHLQHLPF